MPHHLERRDVIILFANFWSLSVMFGLCDQERIQGGGEGGDWPPGLVWSDFFNIFCQNAVSCWELRPYKSRCALLFSILIIVCERTLCGRKTLFKNGRKNVRKSAEIAHKTRKNGMKLAVFDNNAPCTHMFAIITYQIYSGNT